MKPFALPCGCRAYYEDVKGVRALVLERCQEGQFKTHCLAELQRQERAEAPA